MSANEPLPPVRILNGGNVMEITAGEHLFVARDGHYDSSTRDHLLVRNAVTADLQTRDGDDSVGLRNDAASTESRSFNIHTESGDDSAFIGLMRGTTRGVVDLGSGRDYLELNLSAAAPNSSVIVEGGSGMDTVRIRHAADFRIASGPKGTLSLEAPNGRRIVLHGVEQIQFDQGSVTVTHHTYEFVNARIGARLVDTPPR